VCVCYMVRRDIARPTILHIYICNLYTDDAHCTRWLAAFRVPCHSHPYFNTLYLYLYTCDTCVLALCAYIYTPPITLYYYYYYYRALQYYYSTAPYGPWELDSRVSFGSQSISWYSLQVCRPPPLHRRHCDTYITRTI